MKDFGEHYYDEEEMYTLFGDAGFCDVRVSLVFVCAYRYDRPALPSRAKGGTLCRVPASPLAYNICVDARKPQV